MALWEWRRAYVIVGILAMALGVAMALLIENDPRDRGLAPDGGPLSSEARAEQPPGFSVREAVRSRPALAMDYFGGRHVISIIGILYTSIAFGTLIGPSAAGFAFDVSGSYPLPILIGVGGNLMAALITMAMPKPAAVASAA